MGLVQVLESVPGELLKLNLKKRELQVYFPAMGWVSVCLSVCPLKLILVWISALEAFRCSSELLRLKC